MRTAGLPRAAARAREARGGLDAADERRFEDEGGAAVVVEQAVDLSVAQLQEALVERVLQPACAVERGERRRLRRDERLLNVLDRRRAAAAAVGERGREGARVLGRPRLVGVEAQR